MINETTDSKIRNSDGGETVDMCIAIQEIREEGRQEGREEGRQEGIFDGEMKKARETACRLRDMGIPAEKIARAVEVDVDTVRGWLAGGPETSKAD